METRTGNLYCAACDDFIFTQWLEQLRYNIQEEFQGMMKRYPVSVATPLIDNFTAKQKHKERRMSSSRPQLTVYSAPKGVNNLGHSCYLSVILQAMAHNPHMTDHVLRTEHKPKHCASEACVACSLTESLKQLLITEKKEGHAPVSLLHTSWVNNTVSWLSLLLPRK